MVVLGELAFSYERRTPISHNPGGSRSEDLACGLAWQKLVSYERGTPVSHNPGDCVLKIWRVVVAGAEGCLTSEDDEANSVDTSLQARPVRLYLRSDKPNRG